MRPEAQACQGFPPLLLAGTYTPRANRFSGAAERHKARDWANAVFENAFKIRVELSFVTVTTDCQTATIYCDVDTRNFSIVTQNFRHFDSSSLHN